MPCSAALASAAATCRMIDTTSFDIGRAAARPAVRADSALHIFLGDEMHAVDAADLVDLHDVGVHQCGGGLGLHVKPPHISRVGRQLALEHLEGDLPPQRNLLGQIDLGHRPAPNRRSSR